MKKIYLLLLCGVMFTAAGCLEKKEVSVEVPQIDVAPTLEPYTVADGVFDVDAVRSNITIKGQHFDLPVKLSSLGSEWEYRFYSRSEYGLKNGSGLATLYFRGVEMCTASLENCYKGAEKESVVYSISIKTSESDIYGIVPLVSTVSDVEKLLGKPDDEQTMEIPFMHSYTYGVLSGTDDQGVVRGHSVTVDFDQNGVVDFVSVTYSDMSGTEEK